jgi:hypothetical protein
VDFTAVAFVVEDSASGDAVADRELADISILEVIDVAGLHFDDGFGPVVAPSLHII